MNFIKQHFNLARRQFFCGIPKARIYWKWTTEVGYN